MLGKLVCSSGGKDSTSSYSATPRGWASPRNAYSATTLFLPPNEGETSTQFQQKLRDVAHQGVFDLTLLRLVGQPQEVEAVRVLEGFARQV